MKAKDKFSLVMREFKDKELHHGTTGKLVTDRDMAIAIAFSEAQKINPRYGKYAKGGSLDFADLLGKDVTELSYLVEKGFKDPENVIFEYQNSND